MELHYLTLKRQAALLNDRLKNGRITASFTQQKNEQIMQVEAPDGKTWHLLLSADSRYPAALLKTPAARSKNSTDVIPQLLQQTISDIHLVEGERILVIDFEGNQFHYFLHMFRNQANIFLVDASSKIVNAFKHRKKFQGREYQIRKQELTDPLQMEESGFVRLMRENEEEPIGSVLRRKFLYMTPQVISEIFFRAQLPPKQPVAGFSDEQVQSLFREINSFLERCQIGRPMVYLENDYPRAFTLTPFEQYSMPDFRTFDTVNEALLFFIFRREKLDSYLRKKEKIEGLLEKKTEQLDQVIRNLENMPDEEDQRNYYRKMGELLLAHMHQIVPAEQVELTDYFDPAQRPVRLRLNPQKTIHENAEDYFRKSKEVGERRKELENRLDYLKNQRDELAGIRGRLEHDADAKQLRQIEKRLLEMHILQTDAEKMEEVYRPYKQYFHDNWEIWVGKNAKANDEMTFHSAHKEDLWLHAQGVAGSHVIIRRPNRGAQVPGEITEYAARLAATNSSAKHSSYVPVMVTQVKYVRKPKGSAPGAVIPERTRTIFVEPLRS
ncbi:MAG: NFACT family protein [Calditrichia bacterium]